MKSFTKSLITSIMLVFAVSAFGQNASWDYTVVGANSSPVNMVGASTIGGAADDAGYSLTWPFGFQVYDDIYTTANSIAMNSNGVVKFNGSITSGARDPLIPGNSTIYGQFLSYGGQGDGEITSNVVSKTTGTSPNRVLTIAFRYLTDFNGGTAYSADVQISFYESNFQIVVDYSNFTGSAFPLYASNEIGMNAGDLNAAFGTDMGQFPTSDTNYTYIPGSPLPEPTVFTATTLSSHEIQLAWTAASDVMITYNATTSFTSPGNGNSYSAGDALGTSTVLYVGPASSFKHHNLDQTTPYYYKIWSKSATNIYSNAGVTANATTATVLNPSSYSASGTSQSQIDLSWLLNTAGDSVLLVFNHPFNSFITPTDGVDYTTMPAGNGTILTKSKLLSYAHSGLSTNTTYYYTIWSVDGAFNYSAGETKTVTTSGVADPTNFTAVAGGATTIDLAWLLNGASDNVMVAVSTTGTFGTPVVGNTYNTTSTITGGGHVIVYGNSTSFSHASLTPGLTYYYKIWSYDGANNYSGGVTAQHVLSSLSDPQNFSANPSKSSEITLSTTLNTSGNDIIISWNTSNSFASPSNGSSYTNGQDIQFGMGKVLYQGTSTTTLHTDLPQGTKYYYMVWSKSGTLYSSPGILDSAVTPVVVNPTSFTLSATSSTQIDANWLENAASDNIILLYNTAPTFGSLADGTSYSATATIAGGGTVLTKTALLTYANIGLTPGATHYYKIFSYDGANNYSTGVSDNKSTLTVLDPTSFTATGTSGSVIKLDWIKNAGNNVLIAWNTTGTFGNPVNGTTYTTGNTLTSGGTILDEYSGITTNHTGLSPATTIHYKVWSYDASHYYSSGITAFGTTVGILNPDTFSAVGVSSSQIDFTWIKNATSHDVMIAYNTTNTFGNPLSTYPYGVGSQIFGVNSGEVIYVGSALDYSLDDNTKFSPGTTYYFKIWSKTSTYYFSSGIIDSATTMQPGIAIFPHFEDFEDATYNNGPSVYGCQTTFDLGNNVDWVNVFAEATQHTNWMGRQGPTPNSNYTGPSVDHTTGTNLGTYIYTESTICYNADAWLISPLYNFTNVSSPRISFWYHMHGACGSISVQVSTNGGTTWSSNIAGSYLSGEQQTSTTDAWLKKDLDLASYSGMTNIKIRIKGVTNQWQSDMAIDDIKVFEPQNMVYVSSIVEQDAAIPVVAGDMNQEIIKVKVTTLGDYSPLTLTNLGFNITGTTLSSDISNARVYYTGTSPIFKATSTFGSAVAVPSGSFPITGNQLLEEGDNYFWLTYDIPSTATLGNFADAECTAMTIATVNYVPTVTAPTGAHKIMGKVTIGTGTTSSNYYGPMYGSGYNGAHEAIYNSSEMGTQKEIGYIAYQKFSGANTANELTQIEIWMKNGSGTTLSSGLYSLAGYTKVYNEKAFPNDKETGWVNAKLDNAFFYDGTNNLHVIVLQKRESNTWYPTTNWTYSLISNKTREYSSYSATPVTLYATNRRPNVRFQFLPPTPMTYVSSEVVQPNTSNVAKGSTKQEVIALKINTANTGNALSATSITFTTTGTTNASDIENARIYYSGGNDVFSTSTLYGTVLATPSGTFTINGSQTLSAGSNYFWLTYDVKSTATTDHYIDATCTSVSVSGTDYTPSNTTVTGNRKIKEYIVIGDPLTATTDRTQPLHYYYNHVWEGIYYASELGSAKDFNALAFYKKSGSNTTYNFNGVSIYMKHTTATTLSSGTHSLVDYTLVYQGAFPNNLESGWLEVALNNSTFAYNGTENVSVLIRQTSPGYNNNYPFWANVNKGINRSRAGAHYSTPPENISPDANQYLPVMRLEVTDPKPMSFVSTTTLQPNLTTITQGLVEQEILGVKVVTLNSANPLTATSFTFNTTGSSSTADMSKATVFYSGNTNTYAASSPFGTPKLTPNGSFTVNGTQALNAGDNYFWLAYDIPTSATIGNHVDAECTQITVAGTNYTPSNTAPGGNRTIVGALSGEYTIGTGGDYATFTSAIAALDNYGVAGWVKFRVFDGTYTEQISLKSYTNASATNSVTFESFNKDSSLVTLQYTASTSNSYTVTFKDNASHYVFKQMTVKGLSTNYSTAIGLIGTVSDIDIRNNKIVVIGTNNAYALYAYNINTSNIKFVSNNVQSAGNYGVYLRGGSTVSPLNDIVIDSNIISSKQYGLYLYSSSNFKIRGNVITTSSTGFGNVSGIYLLYSTGSTEVSGNKMNVSGGYNAYGLYMQSITGTTANPIRVFNNFISQSGTNNGVIAGIYDRNNTHVHYFYNSVNVTGSTTGSNFSAFQSGFSSLVVAKNNHFVNAGGGYAVNLSLASVLSSNDYNNLYSSGSNLAYISGNIASIAAWRTATSDAVHSISASPSYVSATDLHMTNATIYDKGTPIISLTKDIDGSFRDALTPDIGADEKSVDIDMAVETWLSPVSPICSGTESVRVSLKNYGMNAIYTVNVGWSIDGTAQTTLALTTYLVTGDTANVTLGSKTFTPGTYEIKAWTSQPNNQTDQINANDTITYQLVVSSAAVVDAGTSVSVCFGQDAVLNATGSGYSSLVWTSTGSGTFSNPGSLNATYLASANDLTAGFVYLHLNATGTGTCGNAHDSLKLTINAMPVVSFTGLNVLPCPNGPLDTLIGTPAGGIFTGLGVVGGNLYDPTVVVGTTDVVKYVYTNFNGCKDSASQVVGIAPTLYPTVSNLAAGYCLSTPEDTILGSPTGGTFSGAVTGTSMAFFNPSTQGVGTHNVIYSVTDPVTSCVFDTNYSVQVYITPSVTISGYKAAYCANDVTDTLIGSPAGGIFSGAGMSGEIYNPQLAGVGTHLIEYIYVDPAGCGDTAYQTLTVNAVTTAVFNISSSYCSMDPTVALNGVPSGGVFTVNGTVASIFDPSAAIMGANAVTYSYTNGNGCTYDTTVSVIVNENPVADAGADQSITLPATTATLSGSALPITGTYTYAWSPAATLVNANIQNPTTTAITAPETYTLTVTDIATGCTSTNQVIITPNVTSLTAYASAVDDTICMNDTTFLNGVAAGGSGSYSYAWSSNPAGFVSTVQNPMVYPTVSTTYTLTVDDGTNTDVASKTIVVNALPAVSFSGLNNPYCKNDAPSALIGIPSVGGAFYGDGISGNTFNPVNASIGVNTVYYVYTDPNTGCSNGDMQTTQMYAAPSANAGIDQFLTLPINVAMLNGTPSTGTNYIWSWSPASQVLNPNGPSTFTTAITATTVFTMTVTDTVTGCSDDNDVTIYPGTTNLSVVAYSNYDTLCNGTTAQLNALVSGATGTFSVQWTSLPGTFTSTLQSPQVTPLVTTKYIVVVNNGTSTATDTVEVFVHNNPTVSLTGLDTSYCTGPNFGVLYGTPIGGGFSGAGVFVNVFIPDSAGQGVHYIKYSYTDLNTGCYGEDEDTVRVYKTPVANAGIDVTIDLGHDTILYGGAMGGTGNYDWAWSPASFLTATTTQQVLTNTLSSSQIFSLEVTDKVSGCKGNADVVVNVNSPFLISNATGIPDTICDGDSTTLYALAAGGSGAYTYTWSSTPAGFSSTLPSVVVYPNVNTTYTVQVSDGTNNHSSQALVVVNALPVVSFTGLSPNYCSSSSSVILTGSPLGGNFAGQGINSNIFDPFIAGAGFHQIVYYYTDPTTGCSNGDLKGTFITDAPIANAGIDATISMNASTTLNGKSTGGGNEKYEWTPVGLTVNPSLAITQTINLTNTTTFTLTVTDTFTLCSSSDDVLIKVNNPNLLTVNAIAHNSTICEGDSAELIALPTGGSGTITYTWSSTPVGFTSTDQVTNVKPTITTQYSVTATDGTNQGTASVTITVTPKPAVLLSGLGSSYCVSDAPVFLSGFPSGGLYTGNGLLGNQFDPSLAGSGNHTIIYNYTNVQGCSNSDTAYTTVYGVPVADAGIDVSVKYGADTILYGNASGGSGNYIFNWSPSALVLNNLAQNATTVAMTTTTLFTLTVEDQVSLCSGTDDIIVKVVDSTLHMNPIAQPDTICSGSSSKLLPLAGGGTGNYNFVWVSNPAGFTSVNPSPTVTPTVNTTYYVQLSDGVDFVADSVKVFVDQAANVAISGYSPSYCQNGADANLIGTPSGGVFSGMGMSSNIFSPVLAGVGNHEVIYTYTSSIGCTNSDTVVMNVVASPIADAGADVLINCGGNATIGAASQTGMSYSWSPILGLSNPFISNPVASPTNSTNYILTVQDNSTLCSSTDMVNVSILNGPQAVVTNDTIICQGTSVTVTASGGTTYLWSNGVTSPSFVASPAATTTYYVTVTDGPCGDVDSVTINVSSIQLYLGPDITIVDTQKVVLDAGFGFSSYQWTTGEIVQSIIVEPYVNAALGLNSYGVTVTNAYGCTKSDQVEIAYVLSFEEQVSDISMQVFPNPNKGQFELHLESLIAQDIQLQITNTLGEVLHREEFDMHAGKEVRKFNLSNFAKGVYLLHVKQNGIVRTEKIIIQ